MRVRAEAVSLDAVHAVLVEPALGVDLAHRVGKELRVLRLRHHCGDEAVQLVCVLQVRSKLVEAAELAQVTLKGCLLYTSPSPRDVEESRMPSSA